jgi:hypothetical protein
MNYKKRELKIYNPPLAKVEPKQKKRVKNLAPPLLKVEEKTGLISLQSI